MACKVETRTLPGVNPESQASDGISTRPIAAESGANTLPRVPDYELLRRIGQGAYGEVWLARGLTGAYRAVKIVWRHRFADTEPFQREFRGLKESMAYSLQAGQLALLHVGQNETAGFFYYVMELADDALAGPGHAIIDSASYVPLTLRELKARRGRMPAADCVGFAVELARALAVLHARGLVHRDIKPSNVILVSGQPKLADVGLVASTAEARTFVGTQGYLAPEGPGTTMADVFALGKVVYELATGFDHDEFPRLPAEFTDRADRAALFELNEILLRACEPLPEKRYRDAGAMLADLGALQTGRSPRIRRMWRGVLQASLLILGLAAITAVVRWKFLSNFTGQSTATTPSVSEATQLTARARELFEQIDSTRDDYKLAEDLIAQAKAKAPTDAEVSAAEAQLHGQYIVRHWDDNGGHREVARAAAQRALRLAPNSFEARFAQAGLLGDADREGEEKERLLRVLRAERPRDQRVLRALAALVGRRGRFEEAIQIAEESAALPGGDPLALYTAAGYRWADGRLADAEATIQTAIAQQPFTGGLIMSVWFKVLHGDLAGARTTLKRVSPAGLQDDRAAYWAYLLALLERDTNEALARVRAVPRDWMDDFFYRGPKVRLAGDALAAAGRTDAAALEWRAALQMVDERLTTRPNDPLLLSHRVGLLACLGEKDRANHDFDVLMQMLGVDLSQAQRLPFWVTRTCIQLGRHTEAISQIRRSVIQPQNEARAPILAEERSKPVTTAGYTSLDARFYSAAVLKLNPDFDPLRGYPEFQQLVDTLERSERDSTDAPKAPIRTAQSAAESSEARHLLDRARVLFEALETSRDDYDLAMDLLEQAKSNDTNDAEIWAAVAQLNELYVIRGWDKSDARREASRAAMERALRLNPQSFEARFARALVLEYTGREGEEKTRQLRTLRHEQPRNQRVLRVLAEALGFQGRLDEAIAIMDESAALPGGDPLALYGKSLHLCFAGRTAEAEAALQAALAQQPFANGLLLSVWHRVILHGDLDGAQALLERISPAMLQEDRGAYFAYFIAWLKRDAEGALTRLRTIRRDWLIDNFYTGPKGLLVGDALALSGRAEAAAVEWQAALMLVEERLAAKPTDRLLLSNRVVLLASLGERERAMKELVILTQMAGLDSAGEQPAPHWLARSLTQTYLRLGRHPEAINQIRAVLKQPLHVMMQYTAPTLRLDPLFDSIRDDPEFQSLLKEIESKGAGSHGRESVADSEHPDKRAKATSEKL